MKLLKKVKNYFIRGCEYFVFSRNFISYLGSGEIHKSAIIRGARIFGKVSIKDGCRIIDGVSIKTSSQIDIGRFTSINGPNTDVFSYINPIRIGSFCSIARNVSIQEFNHHYDRLSTYHMNQNIFEGAKIDDIYSNGPINIGNDVWIGTQCVILSGAVIGDGAIVAANSVVTGDVPPYAIVGGSPAKLIKFRFDKDVINLLLQLKWWEWPIEKIKMNSDIFKKKLQIADLKKFI